MKRIALCLALLIAALNPALARGQAAAPPAPAAPARPITLATFARLPFIVHPTLSPDGGRMAGLFAVHGAQVIGVMDVFDESRTKMFSIGDGLEVNWIRWVNDDHLIAGIDALRTADSKRWYVRRVLAINTRTGASTLLLWNLGGQDASSVLWVPSDGSDEILIAGQKSIYAGADFWPSVYRVNVETGRSSIVVAGREGVMHWVADANGNVRGGALYDGGQGFRLLYRNGGSGVFRTIDTADARKRERLTWPFLFLPETGRALVTHGDATGRSGIYEVDLLTQADVRTVLAPPADGGEVDDPLLSRDGTALLGATVTSQGGGTIWLDPAIAEIQAGLDKAVPDKRARIVSFSKDRSRMLVVVDAADMPGRLYYYNRDGGVLQKIADFNEDVGFRRLAPVKLIHYRSRDGLEIEAILTLPAGQDPRALPFIVMPHGGPWAQDTLSYDYWAQFLAHRGYAVLQPNLRGSTGYGTEFTRRGEGQMGLAMQDDVTDGVRWAFREGIADAGRVCIVGASYGGYAAMWGIAKDPDLYRCAVSIAGVASLRREVNDFNEAIMSSKFEEDRERMTPDFGAVSPINAIDRIKAPLLLIHGKRDVTVDDAQSASMFARMENAGKTVEYVPLPLADHYFTREADRTTLLTAMAAFLDKHNPAGAAPAKGGQ